jgi:hypothetical protein
MIHGLYCSNKTFLMVYLFAGCRDTLRDHGESPASGCRLLHLYIGKEIVQDKELDSGSCSLLVYTNDFVFL